MSAARRDDPALVAFAERYLEEHVGEARQWKIRKAALEAAFLLGGEEALCVLLKAGEALRCPIEGCDRGLVPVPCRPSGSLNDAREVCKLCKGYGAIRMGVLGIATESWWEHRR